MFFFFQAEDGIRDGTVTGVQTCALPISSWRVRSSQTCPRRPPTPGAGQDDRRIDRGENEFRPDTAGAMVHVFQVRGDNRGGVHLSGNVQGIGDRIGSGGGRVHGVYPAVPESMRVLPHRMNMPVEFIAAQLAPGESDGDGPRTTNLSAA